MNEAANSDVEAFDEDDMTQEEVDAVSNLGGDTSPMNAEQINSQRRALEDLVRSAAEALAAMHANPSQSLEEAKVKAIRFTAERATRKADAAATFSSRCEALSVKALESEIPAREYILTNGQGVGVLSRGIVAFLSAAGGVGKTTLLNQLAVALATGQAWCGFVPTKPGRVLLACGEEERLEILRQLKRAVGHVQQLPSDKRTDLRTVYGSIAVDKHPTPWERQVLLACEQRIEIVPLHGVPCQLIDESGAETPFYSDLRGHIEAAEAAERPFDLIVLDPMSRFASPEAEVDNHAATDFVRALERLTFGAHRPTVLLAAHTNKSSRESADAHTTGATRGASALTDGARLVFTLARDVLSFASSTLSEDSSPSLHAALAQAKALVNNEDLSRYLRLTVTKNNYVPGGYCHILYREDSGFITHRESTVHRESAKQVAMIAKAAESAEQSRIKALASAPRASRGGKRQANAEQGESPLVKILAEEQG